MLLSELRADPNTGLLVGDGTGAPVGYMDGAEQRLLETLRATQDRSVASPELRRHCVDWPTLYHLSPYRSTIFDCFGFASGGARALELGAGCGAITRWLGEHCGEVHAVEGDLSRAQVARTRCADLHNVNVYCANYSDLVEENAFDVVTLIGVLEYGHLYHPRLRGEPVAAAIDNLRTARRALHDDGVLVLAIENRLGLKYLNGAREDHSGRQFESVQGYPHATSAITFSALSLRRMIAGAGFAETATFLPYPDYKLASTIVNAEHAGPDSGVHNWLPGTAPDRGANRIAMYHEALAQRELAQAGLLAELSNSFLILAYAGAREATDERLGLQTGWRARHYSLDRRPGLRKRVTIGPPGVELVANEPVFGVAPSGGAGVLDHRLGDERLAPGELLVFEFHDAIAGAGFGEPFQRLLARYRDWLVAQFATGWVQESGMPLLAGEAYDASWWNIMCGDAGQWCQIDREWRFRTALPLDYVLWRTLLHYAQGYALHLPAPWNRGDAVGFAAHWLRFLSPEVSAPRLALLAGIESEAGRSVGSEPGPLPAVHDFDGRVCIAASIAELCEDHELLRSFIDSFEPHEAVILSLVTEPTCAEHDVARLRSALAAVGADEAQMPDLLVGVAPGAADRIRAVDAAAAVLTRGASHRGTREPPCVASAGALRSLVQTYWDDAARPTKPGAARRTSRSSPASAKYLSVCAVVKDEREYLQEWIEFHSSVGVEHFYLYDNGSTDGSDELLAPYLASGLVSVSPAPGRVVQMDAYAHCAAAHAAHTRWLAFIDIDEFLFPTEPVDLHSVLAEYETHPAVVVNWVSFGSSGHIERPAGGVLESFRRRGPLDHVVPYPHLALPGGGYRPLNTHVKTIADPRLVSGCPSPHYLHYHASRSAVDEQGRAVDGPFTASVTVDRLRLNHYWSKSRAEFAKKLARGRADTTSKRSWEEFELRDGLCDGVSDELILRYAVTCA